VVCACLKFSGCFMIREINNMIKMKEIVVAND